MPSSTLEPYKAAFIKQAIDNGVLLFGEFTLKSGRLSPYFFNAGLLYSGSMLQKAADAFASTLTKSRIPDFDVLLGPAYKGIPLAAVTCLQLHAKYNVDKTYCYNRKEKKDHGEGGTLVGAPLKGRIVIVDDVLTSGKAVREAIELVQSHPEAKLVGILQLVDRQERGGKSDLSTVQEIEKEFKVPVVPIIDFEDIIRYAETRGDMREQVESMQSYRNEWGIKPSA